MIPIASGVRIWIATGHTDMRKGMHGLTLQQMDYLVRDQLSWMRFCGLGPGDTVPDANTRWDFREALIAATALDDLFARLDQAITDAGYAITYDRVAFDHIRTLR